MSRVHAYIEYVLDMYIINTSMSVYKYENK